MSNHMQGEELPVREKRFILVKPGDMLLIGNAPDFTMEDMHTIAPIFTKIDVVLAVFPGDIKIDSLTREEVEHFIQVWRKVNHLPVEGGNSEPPLNH